jgi:hypothetical protein
MNVICDNAQKTSILRGGVIEMHQLTSSVACLCSGLSFSMSLGKVLISDMVQIS